MDSDHLHDEDLHDDGPMEMYCVRCRETVMVDDAAPVWTRKGLPATRGTCPTCGGTVFRLGRTHLHDASRRPTAVRVASSSRAELAQEAVYIAFAPPDDEFVQRLADDLQKMGLACWLHEPEPEAVDWAGGVHPALQECARMVLVLSPASQQEDSIARAWTYFREKNKPVVIAQVGAADPPDALRRRPRYDFAADYKGAFRQMMQALSE